MRAAGDGACAARRLAEPISAAPLRFPAVLYRLHLGEDVGTVPTMNYNVESVRIGKMKINIWDVGGQEKLRPYWRHYFTGCQVRGRARPRQTSSHHVPTQGIMFVVDSADVGRLDVARDELAAAMQDDQLDVRPVTARPPRRTHPRDSAATAMPRLDPGQQAGYAGRHERR